MPDPIQAEPGAEGEEPIVAPGGGQIEPGQGQPSDAAAQTLTIDGQTYTADQVKEFAKAKADYDRFQPEFTRRSQLLSNPDQLLDFARKQWPDKFPTAPTAPPTPDEQELAKAEQLLRSRGFTTKEEAQQVAQQMIDERLAQREADTSIKQEAETLTKEWDGTDGKPKFVKEDVARYALEHGFPSLASAFREMHDPALREWYASQKMKPKAPVIAGPGGANAPVKAGKKIRFDDESFDESFAEYFGDGK
jgi:hypothetical protein